MKTGVFLAFALAAIPASAQPTGAIPRPAPVKPALTLKNFEFASTRAKLSMEGDKLRVQGDGEVTAKLNTKTKARVVELGYFIPDRTGHLEISSEAGTFIVDTTLGADQKGTDLKVSSAFGGASTFDVEVTQDGKVVQKAANQKGAAAMRASGAVSQMTIKFAYLLSNDVPAHWTMTISAGAYQIVASPTLTKTAAVVTNESGITAFKFTGTGNYAIGVNHLLDSSAPAH